MKTIFKIHPFFYIFCLICILTGYFKNFIFIVTIIFVHELGHIIAAYYYKWKIDKIIILPLGGIIIFDEKINRKIKEEFVITLLGPLFQIPLLFINNKLFLEYNISLLFFNLIPIVPLDGSKMLNLLFNKVFSFKNSHLLSILFSFIFITILLLQRNLIVYISIIFLLSKTIKELSEHRYIFNKFLFERYLYKFNFKKFKIIKNKSKMKRDYRHLIKDKNNYITEKEYLSNLFK